MEASKTIYLELNDYVKVSSSPIRLKDVANVVCYDKTRKKNIEELEVLSYTKGMDAKQLIGLLWIIQTIEKRYPDLSIIPLGPLTDVIVEYLPKPKRSEKFTFLKGMFVALISFFGGAFTIMAFHNDIGLPSMLSGIYYAFTGVADSGISIMEIFYSVGLCLGIIIFFNHVGAKRITDDPTPIEVAMRLYEQDVQTTITKSLKRNGSEKNVD